MTAPSQRTQAFDSHDERLRRDREIAQDALGHLLAAQSSVESAITAVRRKQSTAKAFIQLAREALDQADQAIPEV